MTHLGQLIDTASRANHGRSMQAAADLATSRGCTISKSHISDAARKVETVTPRLIKGIAAGYDIPESEVARAMLADLGVVIEDYNTSPESAIRRDPDLSSEARAILLAAIDAARPSRTGRRVVFDESQNGSLASRWAPRENAAVVGDQDGKKRHKSGRR